MVYIFKNTKWENVEKIKSKDFICWNCGNEIASNIGYVSIDDRNYMKAGIYICHKCNSPNVFDVDGYPIKNIKIGKYIKDLPVDIKKIYEEARECLSVGAYTATIMLLRKILMAVAVLEGAEENKSFKYYLEYLCKERLVHRKQTKQAENVKDLGNDANHKIECRTKQEAEMLFNFVQQFLITNYEFADKDEINTYKQ